MRAAALLLALLPALPLPASALEDFTLPNGMRFLLLPDRSVPVAVMAMAAPVGARQETPGRSGFAHLFEHLMFDGSANVPKGRFDKILEGYGAENNASTHLDLTYYHETLPANALPVAFWLDADRLASLAVLETNMRNQIEVVKEEKRQQVYNEAYMPLLWVEISSRVFSNWHNAHDTYGGFEDLDAAGLPDVRRFFEQHYSPRNLTAAVVGDFDPAAARALVESYFGWIPNRGEPPAVDVSEPPQRGERRFRVEDEHAKVPGLAVVWTGMPRRAEPDFPALVLLGRMLFHGKSARLHQLLVKEEQVAAAVDEPWAGGLGFPVSDWGDYRAPGLFGGFVLLKSGADPARVRELIYGEAERIAAGGVDAAELERAKTKFRSEWITGRQTAQGRAWALLSAALLDGDPRAAETGLARFLAVTPEDVRRAAAARLRRETANSFDLVPKG